MKALAIPLAVATALGVLLTAQGETIAQAQPEAKVIFRDDFTGTSLRPEWVLLGEDPDRWALVEGSYLLIITATTWPSNKLLFGGDVPNNIEISAKYNGRLDRSGLSFHRALLGIQRDDDNYISIGIEGRGFLTFDKVLRGEQSRIETNIGSPPQQFILRITQNGPEYEAGYSFDGSAWSTLGRQFFLNLNGKPILGAYNIRIPGNAIADTGVRIEYFQIIER